MHGTEGSLTGRDVMTQKPTGTVVLRSAKGEETLATDPTNLYVRALRNFQAAVAGTAAPSATGADGIWSLATGLVGLDSAKTGRATKI